MRHARSEALGGRSRLADRAHARLSWAKPYQSRFSDFREPWEEKARKELAEQIGADGRDLLEKISTNTTHSWLQGYGKDSFPGQPYEPLNP